MMTPTGPILGSILNRPEPQTDLERQLLEENEWLRKELVFRDERIAALEKRVSELEVLLAKALKNSFTSSKPPSSDIVKPRKPSGKASGGRRKRGGQPGHQRAERTPFSQEELSKITTYELAACPYCGGDVSLVSGTQERVVQQVEVVPLQYRVAEHRAPLYYCPRCGKRHYAVLPSSVEKGGLIGPILTAQIAYMKGAMHASFSTIRKYVRDVMGLTLSRGYLSALIGKASDALEDSYEALLALVKSEEVVNVDETGHKDNGDRFWTWCFRGAQHCVFRVTDTRSSRILLEVLGEEFKGVLGCDHFSAYLKYHRVCDVRIQFCLAHFIREIRFLTTLSDPDVVAYGERLLDQFKVLFHTLNHPELCNPATLNRVLENIRNAIVKQSQIDVPPANEAQLIAKRLRNYETEYFEFIQTPGVAPTNNSAEQAIRFVTIDRHITQGTRSEKGQRWCERIWTMLATCTMHNRSAYDYLVDAVKAHFNGEPAPLLIPHPT